jgi:hypothetical protein
MGGDQMRWIFGALAFFVAYSIGSLCLGISGWKAFVFGTLVIIATQINNGILDGDGEAGK